MDECTVLVYCLLSTLMGAELCQSAKDRLSISLRTPDQEQSVRFGEWVANETFEVSIWILQRKERVHGSCVLRGVNMDRCRFVLECNRLTFNFILKISSKAESIHVRVSGLVSVWQMKLSKY